MRMTKVFILSVVLATAVLLTSCGGGGGGAGGAAYIPPSTTNETTVEQQTETQQTSQEELPRYMNIDFAINVDIEHNWAHHINHFYFSIVDVDGLLTYGQVMMSFSDPQAVAAQYQLGGTYEIRHFDTGHVFDITAHTNEGYEVKFSINTDIDYRPMTVTDYSER